MIQWLQVDARCLPGTRWYFPNSSEESSGILLGVDVLLLPVAKKTNLPFQSPGMGRPSSNQWQASGSDVLLPYLSRLVSCTVHLVWWCQRWLVPTAWQGSPLVKWAMNKTQPEGHWFTNLVSWLCTVLSRKCPYIELDMLCMQSIDISGHETLKSLYCYQQWTSVIGMCNFPL